MPLGVVVGLAAEARLAQALSPLVEAGGGTGSDGATLAAERLVRRGAAALLSFGLCGGLSPALAAGAVVVPSRVVRWCGGAWAVDGALASRFGEPDGAVLAASGILATAAAKRAAWEGTGALAVDLESGAVARVAAAHHLPFAVLRAVCDPAGRTLPPAAAGALDGEGRIRPGALLRSLASHPAQLPALLALAREASLARKALLARIASAGPIR